MPAKSSLPDRIRALGALALTLVLFACAANSPISATPRQSAVVTGIASGRASVAGEKSYVLRTPGGRVYLVSQVLGKPLREGDSVELEFTSSGAARIRDH